VRPTTPAELEALVGPIAAWQPLGDARYRVERAAGDVVMVKQLAGERYATEVACLERLRHVVPVPHVVARDDARHALAVRWIEGITLDELHRREPTASAELAGSIGKLLARLATVPPPRASAPLAPTAEQLAAAPARTRLGEALADALARVIPPSPPATWLVHGDFAARNIIVRRAGRWRLAGVIDWEGARAGTQLEDAGSLFADPDRFDAAFRIAFARGYRAGGGQLADTWWRDARAAHARLLVEAIASPTELPAEVYAQLRGQLARLVADLAS
jgi:aminoglycoside phosphotransferase (APT) family kinase protein